MWGVDGGVRPIALGGFLGVSVKATTWNAEHYVRRGNNPERGNAVSIEATTWNSERRKRPPATAWNAEHGERRGNDLEHGTPQAPPGNNLERGIP